MFVPARPCLGAGLRFFFCTVQKSWKKIEKNFSRRCPCNRSCNRKVLQYPWKDGKDMPIRPIFSRKWSHMKGGWMVTGPMISPMKPLNAPVALPSAAFPDAAQSPGGAKQSLLWYGRPGGNRLRSLSRACTQALVPPAYNNTGPDSGPPVRRWTEPDDDQAGDGRCLSGPPRNRYMNAAIKEEK